MLKLRAMGTRKELDRFRDYLMRQKKYHVLSISKSYSNKGTDRYCRMYAEVEVTKEERGLE